MAVAKKILFIGSEVTDFMNPIALLLRQRWGYWVDVMELRPKPTKPISDIQNSYDHILQPPDQSLHHYNKLSVIKAFFSSSFWQYWRNYSFEYMSARRTKKQLIKDALRYSLINKTMKKTFEQYHIVSAHYIDTSLLFILKTLPPQTKLTLSYWGSDLLLCNHDYNYALQIQAVQRANAITMLSTELQQIFLAKFGRELLLKTHNVLLGIYTRLFDLIDTLDKAEQLNLFKQKHNIAPDKTVVTIGHCAYPQDRHDQILQQLTLLPDEHKQRITVVLPMTYYRNDNQYIQKVEQLAGQSGIQCIFLHQFLSVEDLAQLRMVSQIAIRISDHDALSHTVLETFYAQNYAIVGAWLPYGIIRRAGVEFAEIEHFNQLNETLIKTLENIKELLLEAQNNKQYIRKLTDNQQQAEKWHQLYQHIS